LLVANSASNLLPTMGASANCKHSNKGSDLLVYKHAAKTKTLSPACSAKSLVNKRSMTLSPWYTLRTAAKSMQKYAASTFGYTCGVHICFAYSVQVLPCTCPRSLSASTGHICMLQGLKRVSDEAAKEWYAATTDEWADLLPSDEGEIATIRPMLAQTSLEATPLRLAYDADEHGWSAAAFHAQVATYGAAVVIAQTQGDAIIGGYNPSGAQMQVPQVAGPGGSML
jgi:hypothetical protein